jgi:cystathionine beta-lyase/cystathionine gamma-synthase
MTDDHLHTDSIAITAGRSSNDLSLSAPIWASTVWEQGSLDDARRRSTGARASGFYSRYANPTVNAFEDAVAALEGAEAALAFASGMGAVASVVLALCSPGDHIVTQRHIYSGTQMFLQGPCARLGIDVTWVDGAEPGAFAAAVRPGKTMLVLAETPANPQLSLVDLDELGAIRGPITVVDSTFATPALQQPLRHGVSLSLHSATKGIAGHNDASLGVIAGEKELVDDIWRYAVLHGATASPYDAHNGLRGIRTLPVRIERASATALAIAEHLVTRREVCAVNHPGLASHPQRHLVDRQMSGLGGALLSFVLAGGLEAGRRFVESVRLARLASSLGGPETLVTSPANSTHAGLSRDELADAGIGPGLVRVSVGLEHPGDLIADFDRALEACGDSGGPGVSGVTPR